MNRTRKLIRQAKKKCEEKIAGKAKEDPKAYYRYANSKLKAKENVGPLEDESGNLVYDDKEMGEILNKYFSTVYTEETLEDIREPREVVTDEHMLKEVELSVGAVTKKIKGLKAEKSSGKDNIHPAVIKNLKGSVAYPLSLIFRKSFETGELPEDWKVANVTPIFKKGSKRLASNYRPVSLTSVVCKMMESLIRDAILEHLLDKKVIKDSQHGFMPGRSCLTNLLTFLEKVTADIDSGFPVDVVYLDFSKAFDKVPHKGLMKKIKAHGIGGNIHRWIEGWLKDRKQRVVMRGQETGWRPVKSGVPQGSVLGPILFTIYINDLDDDIISHILKFVDDTKIFRKVTTQGEVNGLQEDLNKLYEWSEEWQMLFNVGKCKCIHIGYGNKNHTYRLGDQEIVNEHQERDLGVKINETLSPSAHIADIVKKANQVMGSIRRTIEYKNKNNIVCLYKSLVRPHLEYCQQAWRPYYQQDIDNIEKVQRRMTRMINGMGEFSYEERLRKTGLVTLEMRRLRSDLIEVFKIMRGLEGLRRDDFFIMDHRKSRGHSYKIFKQRPRLNIRKYYFANRIVDEWNNLPREAVQAESVNSFKAKIDPLIRQVGGHYMSQRRLTAPILNRPPQD